MNRGKDADMSDGHISLVDQIPPLVAIGVLGAGLLALFLGYSWFWMVFVFGFAVVLPLLTILSQSFSERQRTRRKETINGTTTAKPTERRNETMTDRTPSIRSETDTPAGRSTKWSSNGGWTYSWKTRR
ncbi:hypothetical protein A4G99_03270 [Haladaptatus sp. R4]|nr:hypothetical protein A4G99_03270 [Haladaptatus sp. R4]